MAVISFEDLAICLGLNSALTGTFLALYALWSVQPLNARVYYTRWFILDDKKASAEREKGGEQKLQYSWKTYQHSLDWVFVALRKPERELLAHAGLDMVVYLRMLKLGFKIFVPVLVAGAILLLPTYWSASYLDNTNYPVTVIDYLTMSNIKPGSKQYWVPWVCAWVFNLWALYRLRVEYEAVAQMRLDYLADRDKSADQFTVLVRQVPVDKTRSVAAKTAQFFSVVHRDHYLMTTPVFDARTLSVLESQKEWTENKVTALQIQMERMQETQPGWRPTHKIGFWGLTGATVDSLQHYENILADVTKKVLEERDRIVQDPSKIMPAAFVSFRSRWGAAVAAQTQQSKDNTKWIVDWAPEPGDVCWGNLPINYLSLNTRRALGIAIVSVAIVGYMIPIAFIQALASLDSFTTYGSLQSLQFLLSIPFVNSLLTVFLPSFLLMLAMMPLPKLMLGLSLLEGHVSSSRIERAAAHKAFYFVIFTFFLSNVIIGSAWQRISYFIKNPETIPTALGAAITASSNFFMTYTMIHGWTGVASELVRFLPLMTFHTRNSLLVRTPQERVKAMSAHGPDYASLLPMVELYYLLPFMFWVLAPFYLPFAIIFMMFAYVVYRNQFINVNSAKYDLGGGYWPNFHDRVIECLIFAQITLICVFALRYVLITTILLVPLPFLTHLYNKTFILAAFGPTFERFALEEAMRKDTIDEATTPNYNPRLFLARKYLHPSLLSAYELMDQEGGAQSPSRGDGLSLVREDTSDIDAFAGAPLVSVKRFPRCRSGSSTGGPSKHTPSSVPGGEPVSRSDEEVQYLCMTTSEPQVQESSGNEESSGSSRSVCATSKDLSNRSIPAGSPGGRSKSEWS